MRRAVTPSDGRAGAGVVAREVDGATGGDATPPTGSPVA